jgi:hypothetical protein
MTSLTTGNKKYATKKQGNKKSHPNKQFTVKLKENVAEKIVKMLYRIVLKPFLTIYKIKLLYIAASLNFNKNYSFT